MSIKKIVHVVWVNNYFPEMCQLTLPLLENYSKKIGAELNLITERKFPEFPPTYEKLQVYEDGKDSDWNILLDADMVVGPNAPDVTLQLSLDTVGLQSGFDASTMFVADQYFLRDGRKIGMAGGFIVTSGLTHDLWTPLEFGYDIAKTKTKRQHIVDEYCLSRNLAKFGLKMNGIGQFEQFIHVGVAVDELGNDIQETNEEKIERTKKIIKRLYE